MGTGLNVDTGACEQCLPGTYNPGGLDDCEVCAGHVDVT